ncbi:hypothetical protein FUAX_41050 (plasmid) [Fulvitalea axinellae]|uniref:Uncharacterized protein n=1 Tax=Fulvitalea axinellae TaxID=1182444 RepID=A0AAU9CUC9_9BACT|nr:hypothetical protein FUAX_41050 [Fulvitalea axinellae]
MSGFKIFFSLWGRISKQRDLGEREDFIEGITGKRSLRALDKWEYAKVMDELTRIGQSFGIGTGTKRWDAKANGSRRRIISNFHQMGYKDAVASAKSWVRKQTKLDFNDVEQAELSKLVGISDKMVRQYEDKLRGK